MPVATSHRTLLGGALCLNFTNSRSWSTAEKPYEFFWEYSGLLGTALQLGLLTQPQAEALDELAGRQPAAARAALERTIGLRDALYGVFAAYASGEGVSAEALETVNTAWAEAMSHRRLALAGEKFVWEWVGMDQALAGPLWPVVESALNLLASEKITRVKRCQGCGWLFLDATRDSRRRWCDMKLCGNRAKARRHHERSRPAASV